ncbi:MAG: hypothetical protein LBJ47_02315, partial [Tannerella sp.]|nr:hypothetical protein [Tannerella sp.]
YTKDFTITVNAPFVAVTNITGVPTTATAGAPLNLTGTVAPANATNKTIAWSVKTAGTTGATSSGGSTLNAAAAGTVVVTARIANGLTASTDYTKDFTITVNAPFIPVTNITGVPTAATAGAPLNLTGTVVPASATNQTIAWSVKTAGTTGATISGGSTLNTAAAGTVTVTATIANGRTASTPYTQDFSITVSAAPACRVTLTVSGGITSQPAAGVYQVSSCSDFTFTLTLPSNQQPVVRTSRLVNGAAEELAATRNANGSYTFVAGQVCSDLEINVTSTVGNEDMPLSKVWASGGKVCITSASTGTAYIYNVTGILVATLAHVSGETVSVALSGGLYLVVSEGRSYKVMVR